MLRPICIFVSRMCSDYRRTQYLFYDNTIFMRYLHMIHGCIKVVQSRIWYYIERQSNILPEHGRLILVIKEKHKSLASELLIHYDRWSERYLKYVGVGPMLVTFEFQSVWNKPKKENDLLWISRKQWKCCRWINHSCLRS